MKPYKEGNWVLFWGLVSLETAFMFCRMRFINSGSGPPQTLPRGRWVSANNNMLTIMTKIFLIFYAIQLCLNGALRIFMTIKTSN